MADPTQLSLCTTSPLCQAVLYVLRPPNMMQKSLPAILLPPARLSAAHRIHCCQLEGSAAAPARLQLPGPITCLFPVRQHPEYESIKQECDQWALSRLHEPISHDASLLYQTYLDGLLPLSIAVAYPSSATRERHMLITKLSIWLITIDDTIDAADTETATELVNAFIAVLVQSTTHSAPSEYEYKTSNGPRIKGFVECLRVDVWEPMCQGMTPVLQSRLVGEIARSMKAMKEMRRFRQRPGRTEQKLGAASVNPKEMMALRVLDAFSWSYLVLLEYSLAVEMPEWSALRKTKMGRLVWKLMEAAAAHFVWVNDIISSAKELALKDDASMAGAMLLAADQQGGGVAALTRVAHEKVVGEMWANVQEEERLCGDLLSQIRSLANTEQGFPGHALCLMYAEGVCSLMSGHLYWATRSGRYHGSHPIPWNTSPSYLTIPTSPLPALNLLL